MYISFYHLNETEAFERMLKEDGMSKSRGDMDNYVLQTVWVNGEKREPKVLAKSIDAAPFLNPNYTKLTQLDDILSFVVLDCSRVEGSISKPQSKLVIFVRAALGYKGFLVIDVAMYSHVDARSAPFVTSKLWLAIAEGLWDKKLGEGNIGTPSEGIERVFPTWDVTIKGHKINDNASVWLLLAIRELNTIRTHLRTVAYLGDRDDFHAHRAFIEMFWPAFANCRLGEMLEKLFNVK